MTKKTQKTDFTFREMNFNDNHYFNKSKTVFNLLVFLIILLL